MYRKTHMWFLLLVVATILVKGNAKIEKRKQFNEVNYKCRHALAHVFHATLTLFRTHSPAITLHVRDG